MEYAEAFGEIFEIQMFVDTFVVLNSERLVRKAFADKQYNEYFNDRVDLYYGQHFNCRQKSLGTTIDGAGNVHRTTRKEFIKAMHVYGSGLQDLENNVMTEMELLVNRIENMHGKEMQCFDLFRRSLSNIMSLVFSDSVIDDNDPDLDMFWQHVDAADFFLTPEVNIIMNTFPFMRFIPGKFKEEYKKCKASYDKIVQRYFFDIKENHVPGEVRGIIEHYLEVQRKQVESGSDIFFTDERIIAQLTETVVAGIITTLSVLTSSMLVLLNHPEYQTKIQEELDRVIGRGRLPNYSDRGKCTFLKAFGMEVHRYINVGPLQIPHYCRKSIEFEGYHIRRNSVVLSNAWYIHHDEKIWGDPWTFRPERFLDIDGNLLPAEHKLIRSHIPFSCGPRNCPGAVFSETRYFLYLATLLQRWRFKFPDGKQKGCDPRNLDNYDLKVTLKAKPFSICATER
ncbi:cytochrome P450 2C31-like [Mercenaria mercenaria]|uniref:cytochrome P450 2C31-like n=1 Tax=Mercenaria mercenaria TaxID=6596 RepID=UPI00234F1F6E|nr:cytochrome P450 2C31-like [Mercenaria mercenaria]